jgi:hypothetical protein
MLKNRKRDNFFLKPVRWASRRPRGLTFFFFWGRMGLAWNVSFFLSVKFGGDGCEIWQMFWFEPVEQLLGCLACVFKGGPCMSKNTLYPIISFVLSSTLITYIISPMDEIPTFYVCWDCVKPWDWRGFVSKTSVRWSWMAFFYSVFPPSLKLEFKHMSSFPHAYCFPRTSLVAFTHMKNIKFIIVLSKTKKSLQL